MFSTQFVFEFFYKRVVISWWTAAQETTEEEERESQNNWEYWQDWQEEKDIKRRVEEQQAKLRAKGEEAELGGFEN